MENFSLVSDIVTRRYPVYMLAYESVLTDPERTLSEVFEWVGEGDVKAAAAKVEPALRTQDADSDADMKDVGVELEDDIIEAFDTLHELVREKRPLEQSFVDRLNEVNQQLKERVAEAMQVTRQAQLERKKAIESLRRRSTDEEA